MFMAIRNLNCANNEGEDSSDCRVRRWLSTSSGGSHRYPNQYQKRGLAAVEVVPRKPSASRALEFETSVLGGTSGASKFYGSKSRYSR